MQSMKRAYGLRASQCHANHPASGDCSAPTHSNVTCPSVLTSQTASALSYNDQRVDATSVCGRCFDIHVTSASLPAGPGQSSSDDLARSQCTLLAAAPIAKRQFTRHQLLMSETSSLSPSPQHTRPARASAFLSATNREAFPRRGPVLIRIANTPEHASSSSCFIAHCSPTQAMFTAGMMSPNQLTDGMPACPDVTIK